MSDPLLGEKIAPLSFAQERLWFINAAAPESPIYNVPLFFRWHGEVDVGALRRALLAVIGKHEVLRTTYEVRDGERVQVVGEPRVTVEVVDHALDIEACRGFDLAVDAPVRCAVWKGQLGGDAVLLTIHHIAVDGWSLPALFDDLGAAYDAELAGERPRLGELSFQYTDFAVSDRVTFDERLLEKRLAEVTKVRPGLKLGGARAVPGGVHAGTQYRFDLPAGTDELARKLRVTPFVVFLAAYAEVLARWSGRDDFLVGAVTANRTHPEVENLVGFFVNTVPLRCTTRPGTFAERCAGLRREAFGGMTYQRVPFNELAAKAHGLVDVGFALQNMPAPDTTRWTRPEVLPTGTAKFDVLLIVEDAVGTLEYDTEIYPAELGPRLAEDFAALLDHVVTSPHTSLSEFELPNGPLVRPETAVESTVEPAGGELDERAAELFRAVLPEDVDLGPGSNFFMLGGHSLLAVSMLARAQREYGVVVRPGDFLAEPTVARLGELLVSGFRGHGDGNHSQGPFPATSTQQRFWFLDRMPDLRAAYLVPTIIEFPPDVGAEELRAALDVVLARHPSLRSRFRLDRKEKRVVYTTSEPPATAVVTDARGWDTRKVDDHLAELCWTPFDLAAEAPVRAEVVLLPDSVKLLLCAHHIVVDGASVRVLLDEIAGVMAGAELPAPVHQVADRRDDPAELIKALEDAPTDVWLPHDRPRGTTQSILGATSTTTLDGRTAKALRAVANDLGCSLFQATAALLAVTLAKRCDQRDFLFAFPWSGRENSGAVGMFVNTLTLRVDLRGAPTWRELFTRVRRAAQLAYGAADVPFDEVVAALHPLRDLSRPPITPVYLAADDEWEPPLRGRHLPLDPVAVKYELELTVTETDTGLTLRAAYQADLFDDITITRLLAEFTTVAAALVTNPDAPACEETLS